MSEEVMDDHEFLSALEQLHATEDSDVAELLKMMNENRIISWEEAEQILGDTQAVVKSSLPEQTRPSEPDNDTDIERCVQQLNENDPSLKKINLNNLKRTPIPSIKRLIEAVAYNTVLEELSLANLGLYDTNCEMLPAVLEINTTLKKLNLETNYLSGDFFAKLFKASCVNQTLEEVKAVNQGVSFATTAEKEIIDSIQQNRGLIKVSVNLRLPEGRHKIENATLRNGEIKRVLRREAAAKAKKEAEEAAKKPKPEAAPAAKKPTVAPAAAKPAVPAPKPIPKPAAAAAKPEPKPEPVKAKAEPKAAPAKAEPKAEPKPEPKPVAAKAPSPPKAEPKPVPKPVAAKPKAASPPKEVAKPPVKRNFIIPKKTAEPAPIPDRKTLPVTGRSTSSRGSFMKEKPEPTQDMTKLIAEKLEAKAKEPEKKTVRKVVRKIKKPVEPTAESTDTAVEKKEAVKIEKNGEKKETNGSVTEESKKSEEKKEVNGSEKKEEDKPKVDKKPKEEEPVEEKKEETKPKRKIVKKRVKKEEEGEKKEEEKKDEPRRTFGDDYLTTRPRRRSSAIKEIEIPTTPVKEERPMAVYKLKRESRDTGPAASLEKGAAAPAKPIPTWKTKV